MPRDFAAELEAARDACDWEAHARIWEERRCTDVDRDETSLHATRSFPTEFPDFPAADMPAIPGGFMDTSWHNDVCPSFTSDALGFTIWVDYLDPAKREHQGWLRFRVTPQDHGVDVSGDDLETDSWVDVEAFITAHTLRDES